MEIIINRICEAVSDGEVSESIVDSIMIFYDYEDKTAVLSSLNDKSIVVEKDCFENIYSGKNERTFYNKAYFDRYKSYCLNENNCMLKLLHELREKNNGASVEKFNVIDKNKYLYIRDNLIVHNLRLIIKPAYKYINKANEKGLELFDLYNSGIEGLHRAIDKYELCKGVPLSTYAYFWIERMIQVSVIDSNYFYIPQHKVAEMRSVERVKNNFFKDNGYYPSFETTAALLDISPDKLKELESYKTISMNSYINDNKKTELAEIITNEETQLYDTTQYSLELEFQRMANDILFRNKFKQREIFITYLYNGLDVRRYFDLDKLTFDFDRKKLDEMLINANRETLTLKQIGTIFGMSHERIRQIIARGTSTIAALKDKYQLYYLLDKTSDFDCKVKQLSPNKK